MGEFWRWFARSMGRTLLVMTLVVDGFVYANHAITSFGAWMVAIPVETFLGFQVLRWMMKTAESVAEDAHGR